MIGETVSHYRILEKIGEGGMGEVYLAEDTSLDRKVALKFLPPSLQQDETAHKRFIREAKSAAALDHPFICNIHEVAETEDGRDFIVMEYVEGQTLREELAQSQLRLKDALRVGVEIAEALEVSHQQGIVHRDLKPANIILTPQGHAKVMDFGLAKKVATEDGTEQDISSALTREGATLGTPAYMSPEQVKGDPVDHRSDLFSFGIVLYEMLTGVHPFRKSRRAETTAAILQAEPAPLSRYIHEVPELLEHIVRKMLAKAQDERYQSAHEVRTELSEPLTEVITSSAGVVVPIRKKPSWFPRVLGLAGLVMAVFIVYLGWDALRQPSPPVEQVRKSIAVLPLDNLSAEPESEYFSDGLTEDIIAKLSKIGDLKVISRTSVMLYKDTDKNLRQIGQELGVATILEGSVRRADGRVRVVAQLIDTETDENLWAETYNRQLDDIFAIQSDVAEQMASALKVELTTAEADQLNKKPTENDEAYALFLQGRHIREQMGPEHNTRAVDLYQQALALDPNYADAYAGLAELYFLRQYKLSGDAHEWGPRAIEAARKALELDETCARAYFSLGLIKQSPEHDWQGAESAFRRAVELAPQDAEVHREYAYLLGRMGRHEEALHEAKRAEELDPLAFRNFVLAQIYLALGHPEQAISQSKKTIRLYPERPQGYVFLGEAYSQKRMFKEAIRWTEKAVQLDPDASWPKACLGYLYAVSGRENKALEIVRELEERVDTDPFGTASIFCGLRQNDRVFEKLEEAPDMGLIQALGMDWRFYPIRDDPRYHELLRRVNLEP